MCKSPYLILHRLRETDELSIGTPGTEPPDRPHTAGLQEAGVRVTCPRSEGHARRSFHGGLTAMY